jgi:hypothetical protein
VENAGISTKRRVVGGRMQPAWTFRAILIGARFVPAANVARVGKRSIHLHKEETDMADDKLREKLADYVEDAHAMEQNDLKMIDSMISTTDDPEMKEMLHGEGLRSCTVRLK